jgi:CRISPR system Cascade subunit CasE
MYMTRMQLDTSKRSTMKALVSPNLLHGAVESSFTGARKRRLWRIDYLRGNCYLLILSEDKPDLSETVRQFGKSGTQPAWETKDYTQLLDRITEGSRWDFRLAANPTRSTLSANEKNTRGSVHAEVSVKYQSEWLMKRAERCGFNLELDAFHVVGNKWFSFHKGADNKNKVTLLEVTYEGTLTVMNAKAFREMMISGIGRGKAYGMGLLTVVRENRQKNE